MIGGSALADQHVAIAIAPLPQDQPADAGQNEARHDSSRRSAPRPYSILRNEPALPGATPTCLAVVTRMPSDVRL